MRETSEPRYGITIILPIRGKEQRSREPSGLDLTHRLAKVLEKSLRGGMFCTCMLQARQVGMSKHGTRLGHGPRGRPARGSYQSVHDPYQLIGVDSR